MLCYFGFCTLTLRVRFFKKIQDWILKSENEFSVSLLNRLIQDLSDHGASKEPNNPFPEWIQKFVFGFFPDLKIQSWIAAS